jgi:hypothetical protein
MREDAERQSSASTLGQGLRFIQNLGKRSRRWLVDDLRSTDRFEKL